MTMTEVLSLIIASAALVVAGLAAVFTKKQADQTKRQADVAAKALTTSEEGNDIARRALSEAEAARDLTHREWHRKAQPAVAIRLGRKRARPAGYELVVETDQDLETCILELAPGTPLTEVTGLSVGLSEQIFNHNPQVILRTVKAGTPAHPALWLAPTADGVTVHLRCTMTIGDQIWGPTVHTVRVAPSPITG